MLRRPGRRMVRVAATTAVVAGTAHATHRAMDSRSANKQAQQQAVYDNELQQQEIADLQAQNEALAQQQAQMQQAQMQQAAPAAAPANDMMAQLNQLAQLHGAGVLSDEEFALAKQKLLAG